MACIMRKMYPTLFSFSLPPVVLLAIVAVRVLFIPFHRIHTHEYCILRHDRSYMWTSVPNQCWEALPLIYPPSPSPTTEFPYRSSVSPGLDRGRMLHVMGQDSYLPPWT
ncbi:hypothetical protein BJV74DRAFT_841225 [Russula compacta]|nr:hypothetical protein BJV74DRAFT_841225 [Russula compacta]